MGICFASCVFPFEGLGLLPEQRICTHVCIGWGVCALSLRGFGSRKQRPVFLLGFCNASNIQVNSVNNRKIQGTTTPSLLNLNLTVSLDWKNGWCSSLHCFFPLFLHLFRGYCCLFSIHLKHSTDSASWSYCPSSISPACKENSALGYGSGREYSTSSWRSDFQPSTFTGTLYILGNCKYYVKC